MSSFVTLIRKDTEAMDGAMIAVWYRLNDWARWAAGKRSLRGRQFELERGELVTTTPSLAASLGFGRQVVRRCLLALVDRGLIELDSIPRGSIRIRLLSYGRKRCESAESLDVPLFGGLVEGDSFEPTQQPTQDDPPESLEMQLFQDAIETDQPLDQPTIFEPTQDPTPPALEPQAFDDECREGQPSLKESYIRKKLYITPLPPGDGETALGGGGGSKNDRDETEAEAALIAYAEERLDVVAGAAERRAFVRQRREMARLSDERLREAVDWFADHPMARHQGTRRITRIFHERQARHQLQDWDRAMLAAVCEMARSGASRADVVSHLARQAPVALADVMGRYADRLFDLCAEAPSLRRA